jgi:hypothetical protein
MEYINSPYLLGIVALICVTISLLAVLGFKFKLSREGLSATKADSDRPDPIMPEKYARYTLQLIEHSIAHNNKLRDLWPGCLARQMRVYEEREITVAGMLLGEFSHLLYSKGVDEDRSEDEMSRFRAHITSALMVVKSHIREAFRNNHYYRLTEDEWSFYQKEKMRTIADIISNELTKFWRSPVVTRTELREIGKKTAREYEQIAIEVFRRARSLSIDAYEQEQEEKAKYSSIVSYQTGLNVEHLCQ